MSWKVYASWQEGPWDLPAPSRPSSATEISEKPAPPPRALVSTDMIVSKNLFDPERGAGATREAEENSRAFQRVRNMILLGTVIIGSNRTAIVQDGNAPNVSPGGAPPQPAAPMRLKIGDTIEGFRLTEIEDKRVVFSRNASRVEVMLDYFRKVEVAQPRIPPPGQVTPPGAAAPVPRVIPNLPRRPRIPTPGSPNPTPDS